MSQFPIISAGQRITAGLLQSLIPTVIVKQNATARTSTTTVAADPELTFTLGANSSYLVEFSIRYTTPAAAVSGGAGLKTQWIVPSGATGSRTILGPGSTATNNNADAITMHSGVTSFTDNTVGFGTRGSAGPQLAALETAIVTTTGSGTCALAWSQFTSNVTATSVVSGSFMRITQLA